MTVAEWVEDADSYMAWIRHHVVPRCGGEIVDPEPGVVAYELDHYEIGDRTVTSVLVHGCRIKFHDDSWLEFSFDVEDDGTQFEMVAYSFHYADSNDQIIWRYDLHDGHPDEFGNLAHVHDGHEDNRVPSQIVDLDDVMTLIHQHLYGVATEL